MNTLSDIKELLFPVRFPREKSASEIRLAVRINDAFDAKFKDVDLCGCDILDLYLHALTFFGAAHEFSRYMQKEYGLYFGIKACIGLFPVGPGLWYTRVAIKY